MSKAVLFLLFALLCKVGYAQNVGINSTGAAPAASAGLDVDFTNKGLLIPRMTSAQRTAISSPAIGLLVYQTGAGEGFYYNGAGGWTLLASNSAWGLTGNTGTNPTSNAIGTVDAFSLAFKTSNAERMRITSSGNVGIGTSTFLGSNSEKLLVDAGTGSNNIIVGKGNVNGFIQLNLKNLNASTNASTDIVATNDVAGDGVYIDMGINSSGNTNTGTLGGANKAYLFSTGNDFVIGNGTNNKNLTLYSTDGSGNTTEKLRLNSTGVTFSQSLRIITASTTLNIDDFTLICKNTVNINATLPDATTYGGRVFYIKNASNKSITVLPVSGQLIDDDTSVVITRRNGGLMIQSDGIGWYTIIADL
ncbi:MAG: hypothetical protein H7Y07_17500 [Pyrinomonadaceae bacterium]|nr:hypothetical protein [Sphingobacteriaceae bacterium]